MTIPKGAKAPDAKAFVQSISLLFKENFQRRVYDGINNSANKSLSYYNCSIGYNGFVSIWYPAPGTTSLFDFEKSNAATHLTNAFTRFLESKQPFLLMGSLAFSTVDAELAENSMKKAVKKVFGKNQDYVFANVKVCETTNSDSSLGVHIEQLKSEKLD